MCARARVFVRYNAVFNRVRAFHCSKIHRYSPTEKNRANDKNCHRRKNDTKFIVVPASQHVLRIRNKVSYKNSESKRAIHKNYYQVCGADKHMVKQLFCVNSDS